MGVDAMEIANSLEVKIENQGQVVAHVGCSFSNNMVHIKDLFVREKFRGQGLDEILMEEVHEYAHRKAAHKIKAFCGPEPFCSDGQIPLEQEVMWYESQGFKHDHNVCGVVPVMVKTLQREVAG